jgi:hypothetical protein
LPSLFSWGEPCMQLHTYLYYHLEYIKIAYRSFPPCADQPAGGGVRKPRPLDSCAVKCGENRGLHTRSAPDYRSPQGGGRREAYDD